MTDPAARVLERATPYRRPDLSAVHIQDRLKRERRLLNQHIDTLRDFQVQHVEIQQALDDELRRLQDLSAHVAEVGQQAQASFWARLRESLSFLPGVDAPTETLRSVEAMLRAQYAHSLRRVREAADFLDRLEIGEIELHDEIERLNGDILDATADAELAQGRLAELEALAQQLDGQLAALPSASREARLTEARRDRARRQIAEHRGRATLSESAGARLVALKRTTSELADTLGQLRQDISRYVQAAGARLDAVAGQINAIGAAADAGAVVQDLVRALDGMNAALHEATAFVIETQQYFRAHVDGLVADLDAKAHADHALLEQAQAFNKAMDEIREIEHQERTL